MLHDQDAAEDRRLLVLLVEDDYFIACEMGEWLAEIGCDVLGPFHDLHEPLAAIETRAPDAAVLDVNLGDHAVYPLASKLLADHVPVVFVTGYAPQSIDPLFRSVPRLTKPVFAKQMQRAVADLLSQRRVTPDGSEGQSAP